MTREKQRKLCAEGKCPYCGTPCAPRSRCPKHLEMARKWQKKYDAEVRLKKGSPT